MIFESDLVGLRCRPAGAHPPADQTTPENYFLQIVAVLLREEDLVCYTVDVQSGLVSRNPLILLEFEPQE